MNKEIKQEEMQDKHCLRAVEDVIANIQDTAISLNHMLHLINDLDLCANCNGVREITELVLAKNIKNINEWLKELAEEHGLEYEPIHCELAQRLLDVNIREAA